jgi:transcriptional adapter 3
LDIKTYSRAAAAASEPYPAARMPPHPPAQKGTGKRSAGHRESRRSRSRNTTPSSAGAPGILAASETESRYLELTMIPFPQSSYDEIVDPNIGTSIPDSKAIDTIIDSINRLLDVAEARGKVCDRGMRLLSAQRKDQVETERREQERKDREAADEAAEMGRKSTKMKKKKESKSKEERPLTHGAHILAPQDGTKPGMFTPGFHGCPWSLLDITHDILKGYSPAFSNKD